MRARDSAWGTAGSSEETTSQLTQKLAMTPRRKPMHTNTVGASASLNTDVSRARGPHCGPIPPSNTKGREPTLYVESLTVCHPYPLPAPYRAGAMVCPLWPHTGHQLQNTIAPRSLQIGMRRDTTPSGLSLRVAPASLSPNAPWCLSVALSQ